MSTDVRVDQAASGVPGLSRPETAHTKTRIHVWGGGRLGVRCAGRAVTVGQVSAESRKRESAKEKRTLRKAPSAGTLRIRGGFGALDFVRFPLGSVRRARRVQKQLSQTSPEERAPSGHFRGFSVPFALSRFCRSPNVLRPRPAPNHAPLFGLSCFRVRSSTLDSAPAAGRRPRPRPPGSCAEIFRQVS